MMDILTTIWTIAAYLCRCAAAGLAVGLITGGALVAIAEWREKRKARKPKKAGIQTRKFRPPPPPITKRIVCDDCAHELRRNSYQGIVSCRKNGVVVLAHNDANCNDFAEKKEPQMSLGPGTINVIMEYEKEITK